MRCCALGGPGCSGTLPTRVLTGSSPRCSGRPRRSAQEQGRPSAAVASFGTPSVGTCHVRRAVRLPLHRLHRRSAGPPSPDGLLAVASACHWWEDEVIVIAASSAGVSSHSDSIAASSDAEFGDRRLLPEAVDLALHRLARSLERGSTQDQDSAQFQRDPLLQTKTSRTQGTEPALPGFAVAAEIGLAAGCEPRHKVALFAWTTVSNDTGCGRSDPRRVRRAHAIETSRRACPSSAADRFDPTSWLGCRSRLVVVDFGGGVDASTRSRSAGRRRRCRRRRFASDRSRRR